MEALQTKRFVPLLRREAMDVGNVYKLLYDLSDKHNGILNKDDNFEVIRFDIISGYVYVGCYRTRCVHTINANAFLSHAIKISHVPLPVSPSLPGYPPNPLMQRSLVLPYGLNFDSSIDDSNNVPTLVRPTVNIPVIIKCECGCASIGISNHSDWCPLYEK